MGLEKKCRASEFIGSSDFDPMDGDRLKLEKCPVINSNNFKATAAVCGICNRFVVVGRGYGDKLITHESIDTNECEKD